MVLEVTKNQMDAFGVRQTIRSRFVVAMAYGKMMNHEPYFRKFVHSCRQVRPQLSPSLSTAVTKFADSYAAIFTQWVYRDAWRININDVYLANSGFILWCMIFIAHFAFKTEIIDA